MKKFDSLDRNETTRQLRTLLKDFNSIVGGVNMGDAY